MHYQGFFIPKNAFAAAAPPLASLGNFTALPRPPIAGGGLAAPTHKLAQLSPPTPISG